MLHGISFFVHVLFICGFYRLFDMEYAGVLGLGSQNQGGSDLIGLEELFAQAASVVLPPRLKPLKS